MSDPSRFEAGPGTGAGLFGKLRRGLRKTQRQLLGRLSGEGAPQSVEEELEALEEALLAADVGVATSLEIVEALREEVDSSSSGWIAHSLHERVRDELATRLLDAPRAAPEPEGQSVTLVVGVNGVGKTTSIAKLAWRSLQRGRRPLLAAGDTFRAAAVEQLVVWGERLEVPVIRQEQGSDPAAVVYDALQAARSRRCDDVVVDTAGRLHTKRNLMQELEKIGRVVQREAEARERRTLLVLDATTGQNALSQAREFREAVPIDGIFLTKIDGTAKGGVVVALARELRLPVAYLGVGESAEDIVPFRARDFARALLEPPDGGG